VKAVNTEIMLKLHEEGIAVLSDTTLRGQHCLRAAICIHDLDLLGFANSRTRGRAEAPRKQKLTKRVVSHERVEFAGLRGPEVEFVDLQDARSATGHRRCRIVSRADSRSEEHTYEVQ